jgi:ATP-dependent DNA ligase
MALEPLVAAAESGPSPELVDMTRRFWIGGRQARSLSRLYQAMLGRPSKQHPGMAGPTSMSGSLTGYRIQAHLHDGRVSLYTRSGLDWTSRFPPIAADVARLAAQSA